MVEQLWACLRAGSGRIRPVMLSGGIVANPVRLSNVSVQAIRTPSRVVDSGVQRAIETVSLLALVLVVSLRPLVAEMYDSAGTPFTDALTGTADPSPVRTLVFDLLILLGACGWLLARGLGPARRYRWTGLEWGIRRGSGWRHARKD